MPLRWQKGGKLKTSEPNDYGEIDCECNRCGDLKQSLEFIICDNFSKYGGCYEAIQYQKCEDCGSVVPVKHFGQHECGE